MLLPCACIPLCTPRPCWQLGGLCLAPRPLPAPPLLATGAALRLRLHPSHPCLSPHPSSRCVLVQSTSFPSPPHPVSSGIFSWVPRQRQLSPGAVSKPPRLRGARGAGCCRRGACSLCCPPPTPEQCLPMPGRPQYLWGGAQEAIKNLQGCSEPGCPLEGRGMGESSRARRGKTSCPLPTPTSTEHGGDAQQGTWGGNGRSGGCCEARSSA